MLDTIKTIEEENNNKYVDLLTSLLKETKELFSREGTYLAEANSLP